MTVLVTGGAGYIGSALVHVLADRGHVIRVLDDFRASSPRNLVDAPPVDFVRGDIGDPTTVEAAMDGAERVIHLAAITGAAQSHGRRESVAAVNVAGTETVLEAAEAAGVDRVVFASSCNVYGETNAEHLVETDEPAPRNPYAESKLAGERRCRDATVDCVALRLATNFGWSPGIRFNLVVNGFVFRALAGEPLTVYGDGTNWRPFIHVRDAARALVDAVDWTPGTYNVGHENVRIDAIAAAVDRAVDRAVEIDYLRDRDPGPSYHVDFANASAQGLETEIALDAGIDELVARFGRFAAGPENRVIGR